MARGAICGRAQAVAGASCGTVVIARLGELELLEDVDDGSPFQAQVEAAQAAQLVPALQSQQGTWLAALPGVQSDVCRPLVPPATDGRPFGGAGCRSFTAAAGHSRIGIANEAQGQATLSRLDAETGYATREHAADHRR